MSPPAPGQNYAAADSDPVHPDRSPGREQFVVRNGRNKYHLIPYIGNKSGFAHIFERLMPQDMDGRETVDVFGGSGAFAIYSCFQLGSKHVTYNDNNPILANFMWHVQDNPEGLIREYDRHRDKSSPDYFLKVRGEPLDDGLGGAGRFLYLAKNAFSGKIRFNGSNKFNAPMRKGTKCPRLQEDRLLEISNAIKNMKITNESFEHFEDSKDAFLYLDPPYMNNPNSHYNGVPATKDFAKFVEKITPHNQVMISEQNEPDKIGIPKSYRIYDIVLQRSLQYFTQTGSSEIIAINYEPGNPGTAE